MTESTVLNVTTKESVALDLTLRIASKEGMSKEPENYRSKLLDLYTECLEAVHLSRD